MFIDNITKLCQDNGEKITPLLKKLKLSPGNVQRWKNGATVNSDILLAFSDYFNVSIDYLLTGQEFHTNEADNHASNGISDEEMHLLQMYRALPEPTKEFVYGSVKQGYEAELRRIDEEKRISS